VRFAEADELLQAIRSISIRHRALAATVLAPLGLHPGQEVVLLELASSGPRTQSELATACGSEPPTISGSAQKLEAAGLVARRPSAGDARVSVVELTDAGRALIPELKAVWRSLAEQTIAAMTIEMPLPELTARLADLAGSIVAAEAAHEARHGKRRVPPRARSTTAKAQGRSRR
jgi:DNA-binding MarR family transcriptional regulator